MPTLTPISVHDLGEYLKEQRQSAQLSSLRQLSEVAGISKPYISQIERGPKKPSAEILQALAKALRISAESLYIRAGILQERADGAGAVDVIEAVLADPRLTTGSAPSCWTSTSPSWVCRQPAGLRPRACCGRWSDARLRGSAHRRRRHTRLGRA